MDSFALITLIRRLHLTVRSHLVEELRSMGYDDVSAAHLYVFQTPGPDGLRPTELARRALTTKQAMNHHLAWLEQRGYIERTTTPDDGRGRVVQLTDKGRQLTQLIQDTSAAIERRWERELGPGPMADVRTALARLDALGPA
jgi:DNA-binding MarR family transcriptional regulator